MRRYAWHPDLCRAIARDPTEGVVPEGGARPVIVDEHENGFVVMRDVATLLFSAAATLRVYLVTGSRQEWDRGNTARRRTRALRGRQGRNVGKVAVTRIGCGMAVVRKGIRRGLTVGTIDHVNQLPDDDGWLSAERAHHIDELDDAQAALAELVLGNERLMGTSKNSTGAGRANQIRVFPDD